jgi:hypothetical protein
LISKYSFLLNLLTGSLERQLFAEWPGKGIFFLAELLVDADQAIIY